MYSAIEDERQRRQEALRGKFYEIQGNMSLSILSRTMLSRLKEVTSAQFFSFTTQHLGNVNPLNQLSTKNDTISSSKSLSEMNLSKENEGDYYKCLFATIECIVSTTSGGGKATRHSRSSGIICTKTRAELLPEANNESNPSITPLEAQYVLSRSKIIIPKFVPGNLKVVPNEWCIWQIIVWEPRPQDANTHYQRLWSSDFDSNTDYSWEKANANICDTFALVKLSDELANSHKYQYYQIQHSSATTLRQGVKEKTTLHGTTRWSTRDLIPSGSKEHTKYNYFNVRSAGNVSSKQL
ncbi:hypothetical protein ABEB36_002524 [Hypothenemus hampei]|uniref:Uncharacterized protein n=1 Tax=Hypothenemus hampei TaxID=57062 RepID=A0ABD1F9Q1_HYPHA